MAELILGTALRVMARSWEWGVSDCCTAACDVFAEVHGIDPMRPIRGRYASRLEAARLIHGLGGWSRMCDALAEQSGLVPCGPDSPGALGLVKRDGRLSLGIRSEAIWLGKTENGLAANATPLACWQP